MFNLQIFSLPLTLSQIVFAKTKPALCFFNYNMHAVFSALSFYPKTSATNQYLSPISFLSNFLSNPEIHTKSSHKAFYQTAHYFPFFSIP